MCCEESTPGEVVSAFDQWEKQLFFTAQEVKKVNVSLWKTKFDPQNRKQNKTSFSSCSNQTPGLFLPVPTSLPSTPFCHLSSWFTIALNKVKEAVQLPSWNKCQREKSESTDQAPISSSGGCGAPWRPLWALRWRHRLRRPGDSWGWWRRWWILRAPQSQLW